MNMLLETKMQDMTLEEMLLHCCFLLGFGLWQGMLELAANAGKLLQVKDVHATVYASIKLLRQQMLTQS